MRGISQMQSLVSLVGRETPCWDLGEPLPVGIKDSELDGSRVSVKAASYVKADSHNHYHIWQPGENQIRLSWLIQPILHCHRLSSAQVCTTNLYDKPTDSGSAWTLSTVHCQQRLRSSAFPRMLGPNETLFSLLDSSATWMQSSISEHHFSRSVMVLWESRMTHINKLSTCTCCLVL